MSRNHRTMDYELWGKFLLAGARFQYTHIPFGMFRLHSAQKTGQGWAQTQSLIDDRREAGRAGARIFPNTVRQTIVADLHAYERDYWRETGSLARLGLPERVVAAAARHARQLAAARGASRARRSLGSSWMADSRADA